MNKMTNEQDLAVTYLNGNITYVRERINNDLSLLLPLCDELHDMLSTEEYKLFLKRMDLS